MNMRWNSIYGLGVSVSVFVGGLCPASLAMAQTAVITPAANGPVKHVALESLRQAHRLLVEADHDYDGHRARAAEEVHKAIRELEGKKHHPPKVQPGSTPVAPVVTSRPPKLKQAPVHEAQVSSDIQLREALTIVLGAQAEVNSHHPKAAANVAAAIKEINTALKIK